MHPDREVQATGHSTSPTCTAVIPARYHASRLPGKPLADICGRPMIEIVYRRASLAPSVGSVLVATDDPRIADAVERFGGQVRMTRADHASGSDRLAEVAATLDCDLVVNVQGDEPLLEPGMIEEAIAPFRGDPSLKMGTLRRRIDNAGDLENPNVVKVVVDRDDFALYFSRRPLPYFRTSAARHASQADLPESEFRNDMPVFKHIGLYVYRRDFLLRFATLERTPLELAESLEQLRALEHGFRIKAVETRFDSIGVDTAEDLERVRRIVGGSQS